MNRLRILLFTTLILLSASRLPGQAPSLRESQGGQPAVCNDGKIPFSVARAHRHAKDILFGGGRWEIWGWFNVDPGKCTEIGPETVFESGGWFGSGDAVTLLAFAFWDSKGVFRGIKVQPGDSGWFYPIYPANQQVCVQPGEFSYTRDSLEQSDLARVCDRASAGYILIPASFMYKGSNRPLPLFGEPDHSPDYVHVKISADDRAITSGRTIGSAGISQGLGGGGGSQSNGDASSSMCGKISCWDQFLQGLNQAAKNNEAQRAAANANNNPPPSPAPRPVVSPARAPAALAQRPRLAPIMVGKVDVSHLAGLQRGDTPEYVSSIFGPPTSGSEQDSSAFGGYLHRGSDGFSIRVNYDSNVLSQMKVYSRGSRGAVDPLLDLLGKSESASIALLGPPNTREYGSDIDNIDLYWTFSMNGRPGPQYVGVASPQTLTLHFRTGVGCESVALVW